MRTSCHPSLLVRVRALAFMRVRAGIFSNCGNACTDSGLFLCLPNTLICSGTAKHCKAGLTMKFL